jgi:small-conductance mechanosensitive channel
MYSASISGMRSATAAFRTAICSKAGFATSNGCRPVQQAINMTLFERFESEGIEFAYPTQTVYLSRPRKTAVVAE